MTVRQTAVLTVVAMMTFVMIPAPLFAIGSIGGRPGLPREDEPRSQSIFIHTLDKGETAKDKILLANRTDARQTVELFAVDAVTTNTGSFTCRQNTEARSDTGAWVRLSKSELALDAGESNLVDFTITVPENADVGEHNACIVFAAKDDVEEVGGSLRIRTRSAVRVAITVPGQLERGVLIQNFAVKQEGDAQQFMIDLRNSGNVSADTDVAIELQTVFGSTVYENGGQYPVLPGNKLELTYTNDKAYFWGGWYVAQANIIYDRDTAKWGTNSAKTLEVKRAEPVTVFVTPQPIAIVIYCMAVIAAAAGAIYWMIQRRKVKLILKSWHKYVVAEGDTLDSIALKRQVNWKLIAKINELYPPYTLQPGMTLLVPSLQTAAKKKKPKKK